MSFYNEFTYSLTHMIYTCNQQTGNISLTVSRASELLQRLQVEGSEFMFSYYR